MPVQSALMNQPKRVNAVPGTTATLRVEIWSLVESVGKHLTIVAGREVHQANQIGVAVSVILILNCNLLYYVSKFQVSVLNSRYN